MDATSIDRSIDRGHADTHIPVKSSMSAQRTMGDVTGGRALGALDIRLETIIRGTQDDRELLRWTGPSRCVVTPIFACDPINEGKTATKRVSIGIGASKNSIKTG